MRPVSALSEALNQANVEGWSARDIARRSGNKVSHSVVADYLNGRQAKRPKEYVLAAFTEVFPSLSIVQLRELAGLPAGEDTPWSPPDEVHRLSSRQQRALGELIRAIAAGLEDEGSGGDGRDAASTNVRKLRREESQRVQKKAAQSKPDTES